MVNRTIADLNLEITLHADTWQPDVGVEVGATLLLLSGLRSAQDETSGWNVIVLQTLDHTNIVRQSDFTLVLSLPMFPEYGITAPETLTLTIPVGALTSNQSVVASPSVRIPAMPGTAFLFGPMLNATTEVRLGEGGGVADFNVTLVNDTWIDGVGLSDSVAHYELSRSLLYAISPYGQWGGETSGWAQVVRQAMLDGSPLPLMRQDDATIAFFVPTTPSYDIIAPETLALRIPWQLLTTEAAITAEPQPVVAVTPGAAEAGGSFVCHQGIYRTFDIPPPPPPVIQEPALLPPPPSLPPTPPPAPPGFKEQTTCNNTEGHLSDPGRSNEIFLRLTNDSFTPNLLDSRFEEGSPLKALLESMVATSWLHSSKNVSAQGGDPLLQSGWNLVVQTALYAAPPPPPPFFQFVQQEAADPAQFELVNGSTLRVAFRSMVEYSILVPETVTITLPSVAILSDHTLLVAPQLVVWATPGQLVLSGELVADHEETTLQKSATNVILRLVGDRWAPEVAHLACTSCPPSSGLPEGVNGERVMTSPEWADGCPCSVGDPTAYYVQANRNASFDILNALVAESSRGQANGWNQIVLPDLLGRTRFRPVLWRVDDFTLNLTLPHALLYDLASPETITLTVPRSSVLSDQSIAAAALIIFPVAGRVTVNGEPRLIGRCTILDRSLSKSA